jgi:hypothetical protein
VQETLSLSLSLFFLKLHPWASNYNLVPWCYVSLVSFPQAGDLNPGKAHTFTSMVALIGRDKTENSKFMGYLKALVDHFVKAGGRDKVGKLPWDFRH